MHHLGTKPLETPRLLLRPFVTEDADAIYAAWTSDDEVTRYLTWPTHQSPDVSAAFLRYVTDSYSTPNYYNWGIVWKQTGELIGTISVVKCEDAIDALELGWALSRARWGQGIMPEAGREVLRFLFEEVGANRVFAGHDVNNPKSGRVMQKIGMVYEGTLRGSGKNNQGIVDTAMYAMMKSDYDRNNA